MRKRLRRIRRWWCGKRTGHHFEPVAVAGDGVAFRIPCCGCGQVDVDELLASVARFPRRRASS